MSHPLGTSYAQVDTGLWPPGLRHDTFQGWAQGILGSTHPPFRLAVGSSGEEVLPPPQDHLPMPPAGPGDLPAAASLDSWEDQRPQRVPRPWPGIGWGGRLASIWTQQGVQVEARRGPASGGHWLLGLQKRAWGTRLAQARPLAHPSVQGGPWPPVKAAELLWSGWSRGRQGQDAGLAGRSCPA